MECSRREPNAWREGWSTVQRWWWPVAITLEDHTPATPRDMQLSPWTLQRGGECPLSHPYPKSAQGTGPQGWLPTEATVSLPVSLGSSPTSSGQKPCGTPGTPSGTRRSSTTASQTRTCRGRPSGTCGAGPQRPW